MCCQVITTIIVLNGLNFRPLGKVLYCIREEKSTLINCFVPLAERVMRSPFLLSRLISKNKINSRSVSNSHSLLIGWSISLRITMKGKEVEKGSCWETQRRNRIMRSRLLLVGRVLQFLTKFRLIFLQNRVHSPTNYVIYKPRENHTKRFFATMLLCWRLFVVVVVGRVTLIVGLPPRLTSPWLLGIEVMMFRVEFRWKRSKTKGTYTNDWGLAQKQNAEKSIFMIL